MRCKTSRMRQHKAIVMSLSAQEKRQIHLECTSRALFGNDALYKCHTINLAFKESKGNGKLIAAWRPSGITRGASKHWDWTIGHGHWINHRVSSLFVLCTKLFNHFPCSVLRWYRVLIIKLSSILVVPSSTVCSQGGNIVEYCVSRAGFQPRAGVARKESLTSQ